MWRILVNDDEVKKLVCKILQTECNSVKNKIIVYSIINGTGSKNLKSINERTRRCKSNFWFIDKKKCTLHLILLIYILITWSIFYVYSTSLPNTPWKVHNYFNDI